ncbi:MAG: HEAT repeat domain-containing protein [Thermoanaerobaculia bacterium]|nr:HEAT repeat domain-containing protein [Thermoanaerobaculia bacterium]
MAAESLAELAAQPDRESWIRRFALDDVARSELPELAIRVSKRLLARSDELPEMRRSAIVALAYAGALEELLAVEPGETLEAEALAWALGRCGDPLAQPRLLDLMTVADDEVRLAAAKALGAFGDIRAVPALREAAGSQGLLKSRLARAAEDAIAKIQQRAGGSQAGEISIAVPEPLEGAVSSADDSAGGEVSLT